MANLLHSSVLDAPILNLTERTQRVVLLKGAARSYDQLAALTLGFKTAPNDLFSDPFDGDVSGRQVRVNSVTGIPITVGGNADHLAFVSVTEELVLYLHELGNGQAVAVGQTKSLGGFTIEFRGLS